MALITVVVPSYNIEKLLPRCVNSILNQTFKDFEIIIVNDGSTDSTGVVADKLAIEDSRIRIIHQENGGAGRARNTGINIAKSVYISFIDGDDQIHPEMLKLLVEAIDSTQSSIAVCGINTILQSKQNSIKTDEINSEIEYELYNTVDAMEILLSDKKFYRSPCNKLFRRDLFETIRFEEGVLYEDTFTIYEIFKSAMQTVYLDFNGYYYLINLDSTTRENYNPRHLDAIFQIKRVITDLKDSFPQLTFYEEARLARQYIILAYKIMSSIKEDRKYLPELINMFKEDLPDFIGNIEINRKFQIAMNLLLINPRLFYFIYNRVKAK